MKYVVQVEISPEVGLEAEGRPQDLQQWIGKWQALNPIGMYFSLTRRAVTIIVDVANEDAMFDALHATWLMAKSYPSVWPAADVSEFPAIMQRLGMAP